MPAAQPAAARLRLSVTGVYNQASKGVVEITVRSTASAPARSAAADPAGAGLRLRLRLAAATSSPTSTSSTARSRSRSASGTAPPTRRRVVGADPSTDLAVIKVDAPASLLAPARARRLRAASRSATAWSRSAARSGSRRHVTSGIVSALHRDITAPNNFTITDTIQTDAAINHGNSGGAAARPERQGDRRHRADRERLRRQRRRRLRDPVEHGALDRLAADRQRQRASTPTSASASRTARTACG